MLPTYITLTAVITGLSGDKRFDPNNDDFNPGVQLEGHSHTNTLQFNSTTYDNERQQARRQFSTTKTINNDDLNNALNKLTKTVQQLTKTINNLKRTFKNSGRFDQNANVTAHRYKRGANAKDPLTANITTDNKSTVLPLNATDKTDEKTVTGCTEKVLSGRRSNKNSDFIKNKLLSYLEESFHDVEDKLVSLVVRELFQNEIPYKVGYIVANVDSLAANVRNLREEVKVNSKYWDERKILNVYDRMRTSNSLIGNLLHTLRLFAEKGYKK